MSETTEKDVEIGIMAWFASIGLAIPIIVLGSMYEAWALRHLWAWFVTPQWGLPVPPLKLLAGVLLMIGMVRHRMKAKGSEYTPGEFLFGLLMPLIMLGGGWVLHQLS